jgi:hypothetical protein
MMRLARRQFVGAVIAGLSAPAWLALAANRAAAEETPKFELHKLRGRVVFQNATLTDEFGITTVPEAAERILALQTPDRQLLPIVEDVRGRAFRVDERLRKLDLELVVRRYEGLPGIQVLRVFEVAPEGLLELDYWCDVCSISMVEQKPCECCQAETVLRRTKVAKPQP